MSDRQRVVLLTARDDLRSSVLRLAALVGVEVEVIAGSGAVRGAWRSAAVVVVGVDLTGALAAANLPRRGSGVVVATTTAPDEAVWRSTVELGASRLVVLPADEAFLVELFGDAVEEAAAAGSTIAVVGGCGGAGASTFATALALTAARAQATLLIDSDPLGGGLDIVLGAEQHPGARWPDLAATRGRLGVAALTDALPQVEGLAVLSWDRLAAVDLAVAAATAVMSAAVRGFRSVVVDLPRRLDPASMALAGMADFVIIVVPATVRGTAAAAMIAAQLVTESAPLRLVVRDAGVARLTVAEVAEALGLPVIASLQSESSVATAAARGEPPLRRSRGSLHDACRAVLSALVRQ